MNYDVYHIPVNFTDAGRLFGLFEIRNAIEMVLLTVPVLFACIAWLPLDLTPKVVVTLILVVPLVGFGLIGISDDSLKEATYVYCINGIQGVINDWIDKGCVAKIDTIASISVRLAFNTVGLREDLTGM